MNVYAKFRNYPLRINKALGIFRKQEQQEEQASWPLGTPSSVQKDTKVMF